MSLFSSHNIVQKNKKQSGSVLLLAILLCGFITVLAVLFANRSLEIAKDNQQTHTTPKIRIEAYSFLDLGLSFLQKCKRNEIIPQRVSSSTINYSPSSVNRNSKSNKLIFYTDIIGQDITTIDKNGKTICVANEAIAHYITDCIGKFNNENNIKTETIDVQPAQGYFHTENLQKSILIHNNFQIEYSFEDLSAKVPLCKSYFKKYENLFQGICNGTELDCNKLKSHFNPSSGSSSDAKNFSSWDEVFQVAVPKSGTTTSLSADEQKLIKSCFTIENCVIELTDANKFKLNITTADEKIVKTIDTEYAAVPLSGKLDREETKINNFIKNTEEKIDLATDTTIFKLGVHVTSADKRQSFHLNCYCAPKATNLSNYGVLQRFDFRIVKIEEI